MSPEPDVVDARPDAPSGAVSRAVAVALGLALGAPVPGAALAAGEVSQVLVDEVPATPLRYSVDGRTYTWGLGTNQIMRGFVAGGLPYGYADTVTRVELRRDDIGHVATGNPCGVFVQRLDDTGESLAADYPSDGSGTGACDVPALLASRIVNRGALDLFSNVAPDAKNIERADFVFEHGVLAPFAEGGRALAGHVVGEKRGDNPVRIAAILELDVFGQPAGYGPLIQIDSKHDCDPERPCYAETDLVHEYSFFRNEMLIPQGFPAEFDQSIETVAVAFVDLRRLGLHAGQHYHGFSLFGADVDRNVHVLTDPATFPDDTSDDFIRVGDGADIHGGLAGYFVADALNVATGRVYLDEDGDGAFGDGDAGIPDIGITLYADTDGDGAFDPLTDEPLSDSIDSDPRGLFQLPGLEDGGHFVVLHEGDPDLPGGLTIAPGVNPQAVYVSGADVDGVDFPFSNGDGPSGGGAGGDTGADDGGTGDGGASDTGTDDAGGADGGSGGADGADGSGSIDAGTGGDGAGIGAADGADGGTGGDAGTGGEGAATAGTDGGVDTGAGAGDGTDGGNGAGDGGVDAGDGTGAGAGTGDAGAADGGTDSGDGGVDGDGAANGAGGTDGTGTVGGSTGGSDGAGGGTGTAGGGDTGAGQGQGDGAGDGGAGGDTGAGTGGADGAEDGGGVIGAPDADDASTSAVADSATTEQGTPVTIDVLLNDTDAVGQGLEIATVIGSPDATVTIETDAEGNQTVLYTPDFGFFGTDTFMYTIVDGDGTEATGTVLVTVERFSDIDGNGLNDFDECDCADLTLETGVNGSGIGRVSSVTLSGLAALALLGVRRRRPGPLRRASAKRSARPTGASA